MDIATQKKSIFRNYRTIDLVPVVIILFLLLILPALAPTHVQGIMVKFLIYAIFAISYDFVFGYAGLLSLGHAAFFGTGGYVAAVLSLHWENNLFWLGMPLGVILAAIIAAVFGLIALRVSGTYFLLLTFALAQLLYSVSWNVRWLNSSGMQGIANISLPGLGFAFEWNNLRFFYFALVIFGICLYLLKRITDSPFGHALVGIREGDIRMRVLGYNVWFFKYLAYIISGTFAGVAGVLFAYFNRFISPAQFSIGTSFLPMVMAIIGGRGTLYGAVIGAAIVVFVEYFASLFTPERWPLILGAIFVVSIMYFREGVGVFLVKNWKKVSGANDGTTN